MRTKRTRLPGLTALIATTGLIMAGCGDDAGSGGKIELAVSTFGEFGYEELEAEYEDLHPNIDVKLTKTGQGGPYHTTMFQKLGAGSGLADVVAVEEAHMSEALAKSSRFTDLSEIGPDVEGRWLEWKFQAGQDKDGSLIGYGTDIGPLAMCYRKDLLQKAGLPSDEEGVKKLFETWDSYFAAGEQFVRKSGGTAWYDSNAQIFNAMHNQLEVGYFNTDDQLQIEVNPEIKANWDKVVTAGEHGQSAGLVAFSNEWNSGFKESAFATKTCPAWMIGVIEEQAGEEHAGKWAVTDAFPGGGGNWGGSYLTVPKQSEHPKEAAELAAWLTAPEQQIKAFQAKGPFPSQLEALEDPALQETTSEYFGDAEIGKLFAAQAKKVPNAQYKGPGDGKIQENASSPALQAVEQDAKTPEEAWQQFVADAKKIAE